MPISSGLNVSGGDVVFVGEQHTAGASEALVDKDWDLKAIERMGLPVTMSMRNARMKVLQEKGSNRKAIMNEGLGMPFEGHTDHVQSVCVTRDNKHVVTASDDKTARIWQLSDNSLVRILEGHTSTVMAVCVTPDGKHVVTASADHTARIWLLSDGSLVRTLEGHSDNVRCGVHCTFVMIGLLRRFGALLSLRTGGASCLGRSTRRSSSGGCRSPERRGGGVRTRGGPLKEVS